MESLLSLRRMHWDHEPAGLERGRLARTFGRSGKSRGRAARAPMGRFMESLQAIPACIGTMNHSKADGRLTQSRQDAKIRSPNSFASLRLCVRNSLVRFMESAQVHRACIGAMNRSHVGQASQPAGSRGILASSSMRQDAARTGRQDVRPTASWRGKRLCGYVTNDESIAVVEQINR